MNKKPVQFPVFDNKVQKPIWNKVYPLLFPYFSRIEQTATVRVDNGPIVTGASPGKLRQLNGNGHVYVGMYYFSHLPLSNNFVELYRTSQNFTRF